MAGQPAEVNRFLAEVQSRWSADRTTMIWPSERGENPPPERPAGKAAALGFSVLRTKTAQGALQYRSAGGAQSVSHRADRGLAAESDQHPVRAGVPRQPGTAEMARCTRVTMSTTPAMVPICRAFTSTCSRDGKYKHAAAFAVRAVCTQHRTPVSALVTNFSRDGFNQDELETLFHEFATCCTACCRRRDIR